MYKYIVVKELCPCLLQYLGSPQVLFFRIATPYFKPRFSIKRQRELSITTRQFEMLQDKLNRNDGGLTLVAGSYSYRQFRQQQH